MRAKRNKCKIVAIVQMFIFMWRFIYRSRRGCLNSLMTDDDDDGNEGDDDDEDNDKWWRWGD